LPITVYQCTKHPYAEHLDYLEPNAPNLLDTTAEVSILWGSR